MRPMTKPSNRELAKTFDDIAEDFDRLANPYTVRRRAETLAALADGRILEIGGGTGAVSARLADRTQVWHSDISLAMCRVARRKLGVPSLCCDAEALPLGDTTLDTLIASEVVYYLDDPLHFFSEARRVLRPGGKLLIHTTSPAASAADRVRTMLRRLGFAGMYFDDGIRRFLGAASLSALVARAGLVPERISRQVLLPFSVCDRLNRILERTPARCMGLFMLLVAHKPIAR